MFGWLFDWFGDFFKQVARTFIGKTVESIKDEAINLMRDYENYSGLSEQEKFKKGFGDLKNKYPSFEDAVINLAISAAMAVVKDEIKEIDKDVV